MEVMMKKIAFLACVILSGCSSSSAELEQYCSFVKASHDISRQANQLFPDSLTSQDMKKYQQRKDWVEVQHQALREKYQVSKPYPYTDEIHKNGWMPATCKEAGLW